MLLVLALFDNADQNTEENTFMASIIGSGIYRFEFFGNSEWTLYVKSLKIAVVEVKKEGYT